MAVYDILELDELVLSYAMMVHKSQGGEFDIVILPISFHHRIMLQRNLFYTAVTRAKKLLILVFAIDNNTSKKRYSKLDERLKI